MPVVHNEASYSHHLIERTATMAKSKHDNQQQQATKDLWVNSLAKHFDDAHVSPESRMRTMISCDVRSGRASIYVPPDMSELQPQSLRYLHSFARQHDLQLVEDRRRVSVQPITEKRNRTAPVIAKGLSELLTQLGMPGDIRPLSQPHRLAADGKHTPLNKLIRMAAFSAPYAKNVVIQPNRNLLDILNGHSTPINAYGCKLVSEDSSTVLSHFESTGFRGLGYSAGRQYIMHVCLASGPLSNPEMWAEFHTLTRTDFQFQLFQAQDPKNDVGLFYATFYIDLSGSPAPWWLSSWSDTRFSVYEGNNPTMLQRAS